MKKIVCLSFPQNDKKLGLEPSILYVAPPGENVIYSQTNTRFVDSEVEMYLCSVYITGYDEFREWTRFHSIRKIVVGGYFPTMFPERFLNYAWKIIMGPCDDIALTLSQTDVKFEREYYLADKVGNSRFVGGHILRTLQPIDGCKRVYGEKAENEEISSNVAEILDNIVLPGILSFKSSPRYDIYDITNNQQVIPNKRPTDLSVSINSSFGCPYSCDFCCTPVMFGTKLISRPMEALERDSKIIKASLQSVDHQHSLDWYCFIRDENFALQYDYAERLRIISLMGVKTYLFASANTLTEEKVKVFAKNNVYMVCLGLEDPTKSYAKNKKLFDSIQLLKKYGIFTYLSFIVDPTKVISAASGIFFYEKLKEQLNVLLPEMVCGNFLMPFPGTPMWDEYYWMVSEEDFKHYDSKTPFMVKNEIVKEKMRYYMFKAQWDYYISENYNSKVRKFSVDDTLSLRFTELYNEFDNLIKGIKTLRP